MNAEELLTIASDLIDEVEQSMLVDRVRNIRDTLNQTINNPGDVRAQQRLAHERIGIREVSEASRVNSYPPVWQNRLYELGISDHVGESLSDRIESIFLENEITPQAALDQIVPITTQVENTLEALQNIAGGLRHLGFGTEQIETGECELSVLIPASRENCEADRLATEFAFVDATVKIFSEIANLGRPPTRIRALASSDFLIYVYAAYEVASCLGGVIERITQMHSRLKRLKELIGEFKDLRGPDQLGEEIQGQVDEEVERELNEITEHVISEASVDDEGRVRELRTEMRRTVRGIAARVDHGYRYEIRMELSSGEGSPEDQERHDEIRELATRIEYTPPVDHPVLALPPVARFVVQEESENGAVDGSNL